MIAILTLTTAAVRLGGPGDQQFPQVSRGSLNDAFLEDVRLLKPAESDPGLVEKLIGMYDEKAGRGESTENIEKTLLLEGANNLIKKMGNEFSLAKLQQRGYQRVEFLGPDPSVEALKRNVLLLEEYDLEWNVLLLNSDKDRPEALRKRGYQSYDEGGRDRSTEVLMMNYLLLQRYVLLAGCNAGSSSKLNEMLVHLEGMGYHTFNRWNGYDVASRCWPRGSL